jgi:uncharacterized protein (TIGR02266 family)
LTPPPPGADTDNVVSDLPLVRLRLKYADTDTFVERFAPNVTRGGIFLASREPRPIGAVVRFEVLLMSGPPVLSGEGRVTWVKEFNPTEPQRPHGMGVQFTVVDPACRPVLARLLSKREASGRRPTTSIPVATTPQPVARPTTDFRPTEVTLPADLEFLDESSLRRVVDRARLLSARTEDVEELRKSDPEEPVTISQALGELSRYFTRRAGSGLVRLPQPPPGAATPSGPAPPPFGGGKPGEPEGGQGPG